MADNNLPLLTVTAPNGEQQAVMVFGFPVPEEELIPLEEWLRPSVNTPAPGTTTHLASAAVSGSASLPPNPPLDVDNASYDKIWEHVHSLHDAAALENTQVVEDIAYLRLPDTLVEYKTKRVAAIAFIAHRCRVYEFEFKNENALRAPKEEAEEAEEAEVISTPSLVQPG